MNTSSAYVVETEALTKLFGAHVAVDHVDLRIPAGSAFGYLGPNGAGKTTLIRTLLGLTAPSSGSIRLLGRPIPEQRREALARVGAIVEEPRFHPFLTGRDNLSVVAAARGRAAHARIPAALDRVGLAQRADDRVGSYSLGMRQRLGVARCLLADPELLILDEPMNGLDPAGMEEMRLMIRALVDEGRTVVLSSHLLDEVEKTCDAIAIVDQGRIVAQGSIAELTGDAATVLVATSDDLRAQALLAAHGVEPAAPPSSRTGFSRSCTPRIPRITGRPAAPRTSATVGRALGARRRRRDAGRRDRRSRRCRRRCLPRARGDRSAAALALPGQDPRRLIFLLAFVSVGYAVAAVASVAFAGSLAAPSTGLLASTGLWLLAAGDALCRRR